MNNKKFIWVEIVKAVALIWIFINHISERFFGYPMFANPIIGWPPFQERLAQLQPLNSYGLWNLPINILRYIGWTGDQGVQLFIITSGFGLTWGLLNRQAGKPLTIKKFYLRRAERIFPLWWGAHVLFILVWILTGWGLSVFNPATFASLLGIRVTPSLIYYFSPAWWYIWLIIQLYLIYPLLWEGLRRFGPLKLLLCSSLIAFGIRGVGLYYFEGYLDAWSRGAIFITRLPEFVFGISFATLMYQNPNRTEKRLHSPLTWVLAIAVYFTGLVLSLTLPGMIIAPFLLGVGVFTFLYLLLDRLIPVLPGWAFAPGVWVGEHSYSLYLVHNPVILVLISSGFVLSPQTIGRVMISIILTIVLALLLERSVDFVTRVIRKVIEKIGVSKTVVVGGLVCISMVSLLISTELLVRRLDPQEVLGWGERPSLEPDSEIGWRLIPSKNTRLRWLSYDYMVESNSLGFPGPEYPIQKEADTYRIMVTGDAFSSAEGVDTFQAWPRLLEASLTGQNRGIKVEVLNFSITGYGPNQYVAVIKTFAPVYKPDLIIVQTFVNDFQDVLLSNDEFQASIGFQLSDQNGLGSIMKIDHFRRWINLNVFGPVKEFLRNEPNDEGYFLGNFSALERKKSPNENDVYNLVKQDLFDVKKTADKIGAKVIVFMVPTSVQICDSSELAYYPRHIDLNNQDMFDLNKPQMMMAEIANSLQLPFYDLREMLEKTGKCIYQPRNMHWSSEGHKIVAQYFADLVTENGFIP